MTRPANSALDARWRRLTARINAVREAVATADEHKCPDAVAHALDALYELWEYWCGKNVAVTTMKDADDCVAHDAAGETTAALIHARGAKTHTYLEFGDFTNTYSLAYHDHYGAWRWQSFTSTGRRFATRHMWYQKHVVGQEVMPVFEAAVSWLRAQPELVE